MAFLQHRPYRSLFFSVLIDRVATVEVCLESVVSYLSSAPEDETGAASVALPFIQKCVLFDDAHVLLTSPHKNIITTVCADGLHPQVTAFHLPFNSIQRFVEFVHHWKPQIAFFLEECNLELSGVQCLHQSGCRLVLFHARFINDRFFDLYSCSASRFLFQSKLSYFSVIFPETQQDAGRLCLLGIPLQQMPGWCADLRYAAEVGEMAWTLRNIDSALKKTLKKRCGNRTVWIAFVAHERDMMRVSLIHSSLKCSIPDLLLFLIPETKQQCEMALRCLSHHLGLSAQMWSTEIEKYDAVDTFVVDPLQRDHIHLISHEADIAFIGHSSVGGREGNNVILACIANCAVVTERQTDDFDQLMEDINHSAVVAAEEAEAVVYHSGRLRICGEDDDNNEQDDERAPRPANGMLHHLSSRTSSSTFSFVADILMSSFPYPSPTGRPQTAPPATSRQLRGNSSAEQVGVRLWRQTSFPTAHDRPRTAELESTSASFHSVTEETVERSDTRNPSRASNPEEPFIRFDSSRRGDFTVFQIDEEHYDTDDTGLYQETPADVSELLASSAEDEQHPSGLMFGPPDEDLFLAEPSWMERHPSSPCSQHEMQEAELVTPQQATPSDSRSLSPVNTARSHRAMWDQEVRIMSPSGDYVTPATHLPFGTNGPAIWSVQSEEELEAVLHKLLIDRLERRSRAHAALQGAARFAIGLVLESWKVVYDHVVEEVLGQD